MGYYGNTGGSVTSRYTVTQPYYTRTPSSYDEEQEALKRQQRLFELEKELEHDLVEFRGYVEAWMAGRVSLDYVLDMAMQKLNLCGKIGVWSSSK